MEDEQTKDALRRIIKECLHQPAKKKDFVREGSLGLLLELCRSRKRLGVKAYAAAALAVLSHQNNSTKSDIIELWGSKTLMSMCRPFEDILDNQSTKVEKLLCHEQTAALLQKLTYQNNFCQADLVNAGIVRHLIQLCDIFNPNGSHSNCCQASYSYSKKANDKLRELTMNKKLIGNVSKLSCSETSKKMASLVELGAEVHTFGQEINTLYKIDLYDTTTCKDIKISDELKDKGLAWPDLTYAYDNVLDEKNSPGKEVKSVWSDVALMSVIDAGHFWAHVGGDVVKNNLKEIQECLKSQELASVSEIPRPGSLVCCQEVVSGEKMLYRARILDVTSRGETSKAKIFAIDYGFTTIVPPDLLHTIPPLSKSYPPQVSLCCLSGVQAPPENPSVLEYTVGALRNLCEMNEDFITYIVTSGGIEALLKLCLIPNKRILLQAIGALSNLALDFRYRPRIGYLGGIKVLLNLCLQHEKDDDILLIAVGAIQTVLVNSDINCLRALEAKGLGILVHVYCSATKEEIKSRTLRALKNLTGRQDEPKKLLDMRSVMDVSPAKQSNFSLSIKPDDGYKLRNNQPRPPDIDRSRRRRARRGRVLVDPKPTQVSMSVEDLNKQASNSSDSMSDTDSDERYAGRWTSETDVDTDGEMLIKDSSTVKTLSYNKLAETQASERYYVQTHYMSFTEDETHEFSSQTNVHDISKRKIAKTLCAFLNNKTCGTIYIGVRNSGEICGIRVKRKERDLLRLGLDEMVEKFKPPLKPDMYKIEFVPIARPSGSESAVTRKLIDDRYVIEILLVKYTRLIYTTPQMKCYFRHKSANIELTTQEVREKTIKEQEASYNDEIKRLRKELRDMRKLIKPNTSSSKPIKSDAMPNSSVQDKPNFDIHEPISSDIETNGCVVM